ncbi:MAG: ROK family protein [Ferruginibacter sp.]
MNKDAVLGVDIGGSHITAAVFDVGSGSIIEETLTRNRVDNSGESNVILNQWLGTLRSALSKMNGADLKGIGFAIPGPFNYEEGICLMEGVNKYDALYGVNISDHIVAALNLPGNFPIKFENDAACFGLGESLSAELLSFKNIIAITLGTGFGATFIHNKQIKKRGEGIPPSGELYNFPYRGGIAEDYVSSAWLLNKYNQSCGGSFTEVAYIAERANAQDKKAQSIFIEFGENLAACLIPWIKSFRAECLVIGGSISKSSHLFLSPLRAVLLQEDIHLVIKTSTLMELSAVTGAASLIKQPGKNTIKQNTKQWRKTSQDLLPANTIALSSDAAAYNIYPFCNIGDGKIFSGYGSLAAWMATQQFIMIDGYGGNDWKMIQSKLAEYFNARHLRVCWYEMHRFQKPVDTINEMITPFLGEHDSVWGTRTNLTISDFYDVSALDNIKKDSGFDLTIIIGTGAALANWETLIYVDLPKNEIQYRMRAGSITNLGNDLLEAPALMYKRFYFVDWVVFNNHREQIAGKISVIADGQWKDTINWAFSAAVQEALLKISKDVIRVRPWFEAGAWGGQWIKDNIPQINKNEVNYAWSFELIAPENGLVLESDHNLLELSFDWLMELQTKNVLGKDAERFGTSFPIRFDFLDTFDGGNLSIQCHPTLNYIRENFGESITQDETYYILDCKNDAKVYLGFQETIDPATFKTVLEASLEENKAIEIEQFVQSFSAKKHDLFLIPNGTIHSAGKDNMVLEISATPYIFTFKMYDWVRLDLEGNPRPINIDHAFKNLNFNRKGESVAEELVSKQTLFESNDDYSVINLSTHADHFYAVQRIEVSTNVKLETGDQCHILMLVEGESITIKAGNGTAHRFNYAETFIVPAAAISYEIINNGKTCAKVIRAFVK